MGSHLKNTSSAFIEIIHLLGIQFVYIRAGIVNINAYFCSLPYCNPLTFEMVTLHWSSSNGELGHVRHLLNRRIRHWNKHKIVSIANYILKSTEWIILPVNCLLIPIAHYYIEFIVVKLCVKYGIYLLWEQGIHFFLLWNGLLCQNIIPGWYWTAHMSQQESKFVLSFLLRQSVSLFFQRMHNCCFLG